MLILMTILALPTIFTFFMLIVILLSSHDGARKKWWAKQVLLGWDQMLNTWAMGWADESFSSRSYRLEKLDVGWAKFTRPFVDFLFFFEKDHCRKAYLSEQMLNQMPPELRHRPDNATERYQ